MSDLMFLFRLKKWVLYVPILAAAILPSSAAEITQLHRATFVTRVVNAGQYAVQDLGAQGQPTQDQEAQLEFAVRTWTDNQGRTIDGRFGGLVDPTRVRIIAVDKTHEVLRTNLSPEDQAYVDEALLRYDPRVHGRRWTPLHDVSFRGSFVQVKSTQVWILTSFEDERLEIEAIELSPRDLEYVCETLDQRVKRQPKISGQSFRVWTAKDDSWCAVGRLKQVTTRHIVLEQEDEEIEIELGTLSDDDRTIAIEAGGQSVPTVIDPREKLEPKAAKTDESPPDAEGSSKELRWSDISSIHPIFYVFIGVSIFALIAVIAFKYISESFQDDEEQL